ncbi:hypothetical protein EJ08DRAFT_316004 [Tothia fuscella]|uniref:Uncharacterized protein n=1 Tax=Tothia fuscella TaxID=1048955 RepID=A0A9P4NNE4_9PEZI|nr:hypothetical protein EJ08DRAFT_316004 [Tothia fuscella]
MAHQLSTSTFITSQVITLTIQPITFEAANSPSTPTSLATWSLTSSSSNILPQPNSELDNSGHGSSNAKNSASSGRPDQSSAPALGADASLISTFTDGLNTITSATSVSPLDGAKATPSVSAAPASGFPLSDSMAAFVSSMIIETTSATKASSSASAVPKSVDTSINTPLGVVTNSDPNILPVAVFVTNGQTATYSEEQNTDLATITDTRTVSTTLVASESGKTTSAVIPLLVIPGGFYWNPPILPGLHLPQLPPLLTPPPFPKPPCFKLGGLFAINCPPAGGSNKAGGGGSDNDDGEDEPPQQDTKPPPGENTITPTEDSITSSSLLTSSSSTTSSSSLSSRSSSTSSCGSAQATAINGIVARADTAACAADRIYTIWPKDG